MKEDNHVMEKNKARQKESKRWVVFLEPRGGGYPAEAATMVVCRPGAGAMEEMWLETQEGIKIL